MSSLGLNSFNQYCKEPCFVRLTQSMVSYTRAVVPHCTAALKMYSPELYHPIIDSITELLRIMTMCVGDALHNIRDAEKGNIHPLTLTGEIRKIKQKKSKFWSKIEIVVKNWNFGQKMKVGVHFWRGNYNFVLKIEIRKWIFSQKKKKNDGFEIFYNLCICVLKTGPTKKFLYILGIIQIVVWLPLRKIDN